MHSVDKKIFILLIFSIALSSCSEDSITQIETENQANTTILATRSSEALMDLSYGEESQKLYDIYLPANRSSATTKVFVLIHGGNWTSGDKNDMNSFVERLQRLYPNHAIANVNYVLSTQETTAFPNQFFNIGDMLDELTEKSEEYQILPEFALIGQSAGAHLSLMYDYEYDELDRVKMVCSIAGPTDFTNPFYQEDRDFEAVVARLVDEDAYPPNANIVRRLSPALRVNPDSSPTIIFHGINDNIVPLANAKKLKRKLKKKFIPKKLVKFEAGHANWNEDIMAVFETKFSRFVNNHFAI